MKKETNHFTMQFHECDKDAADVFGTILEETYERLYHEFSGIMQPVHQSKKKYEFFLCKDAKEYILLTHKKEEEYQDWMVGNSNFLEKRICLISPNGADRTEEELQQVLVHELVHMVLDDMTGIQDNECWLAEGIAILYAGQTDMRYVSREDFPRITDISGNCNDEEAAERFAENGGYDYAGIYVWYYIKLYGADDFLRAYKNEMDVAGRITEHFEADAIREYSNAKVEKAALGGQRGWDL